MGRLLRYPTVDVQNVRIPRVVGILLAAGSSRRMGRPKLALRWPDGRSIGGESFRQLRQSVMRTILVVRPDDPLDWLQDELEQQRAQPGGSDCCSIVRCAESETEGMAASLRAGITAAAQLGADGALIALADQPFVGCRLMRRLVHAFQVAGNADWAAASCNGQAMPPVILSSRLYPRVLQLTGDEGARRLLNNPSCSGVLVPAESSSFLDIDTPDEWHYALRMRAGYCAKSM
ncbi:nucleotidyltransferase family protein [Paenibacillus xylaniclasticus]|uniref:nucleotidyltransferase family protein n=1 Tax=Paenibacillus xylaniclasticus TaxID=588083 RepID=UPI000FD9A4BC|nr:MULTISPECIES: nucleotidyltransferase family protein [Paenibacillus]GFN33674.1 xanthine dehydrogenase accessory protein PucB [Paenibacillus curdlanolyticus]